MTKQKRNGLLIIVVGCGIAFVIGSIVYAYHAGWLSSSSHPKSVSPPLPPSPNNTNPRRRLSPGPQYNVYPSPTPSPPSPSPPPSPSSPQQHRSKSPSSHSSHHAAAQSPQSPKQQQHSPKPVPKPSGGIGQSCKPGNVCDPGSYCSGGMCYEICHGVGSCLARNVPRKNTYYCDYVRAKTSCVGVGPAQPSTLSKTPVLATGGPPGYPAQLGNNTNYIAYEDHKWEGYRCSVSPDTSPYTIGQQSGRVIGRVNQSPDGTLQAMLTSCTDPTTGNMQGKLVAQKGWTAYQNTGCTTCPNAAGYQPPAAAAAKSPPTCQQCPPGWRADGSNCSAADSTTIQALVDRNLPTNKSISIATLQHLFPGTSWSACPNVPRGTVQPVCQQCPPGWSVVPGDGNQCRVDLPITSTTAGVTLLDNQHIAFRNQQPLSVSQLMQAGLRWPSSCISPPPLSPAAAIESRGPLTPNQLQRLRAIPLAPWQVQEVVQLWNSNRSYLSILCTNKTGFYNKLGTITSPPPTSMTLSGTPPSTLQAYAKICDILNISTSSSSPSPPAPPDAMQHAAHQSHLTLNQPVVLAFGPGPTTSTLYYLAASGADDPNSDDASIVSTSKFAWRILDGGQGLYAIVSVEKRFGQNVNQAIQFMPNRPRLEWYISPSPAQPGAYVLQDMFSSKYLVASPGRGLDLIGDNAQTATPIFILSAS